MNKHQIQVTHQRTNANSSKQTTLNSNFTVVKNSKFYTPDKTTSKSGAASRAMRAKQIQPIDLPIKQDSIQEYAQTFNTQGYRSAKRIQQIMGGASSAMKGNSQNTTASAQKCNHSNGKNSAASLFANSQTSATTACTMSTQRDQKLGARYGGADILPCTRSKLLQKRKPAMTSDQLEKMVKVLVNKKTNERKQFLLVDESKLKAQKQDNHEIYNYNMDKLEVEYDYDTDQEQVTLSKKHLETDFFEAVKFSVVESPLVLCGNLEKDIKNPGKNSFFN